MFNDRVDGARRLLPRLAYLQGQHVVVLAIPRGGVVTGYAIAQHFGWPLGVVLTKKIGHPIDPEYAIGAVSIDSVYVAPRHHDVDADYVHEQTVRLQKLLRERASRIAVVCPPPDLAGATVVIVDDGIATGHTMRAAIAATRKQRPSRIVVAAPVAAPSIPVELGDVADDVVILDTPDDFMGVGQFYAHFDQVEDAEVERLLISAHAATQPPVQHRTIDAGRRTHKP